jgi:hypothetical protein
MPAKDNNTENANKIRRLEKRVRNLGHGPINCPSHTFKPHRLRDRRHREFVAARLASSVVKNHRMPTISALS